MEVFGKLLHLTLLFICKQYKERVMSDNYVHVHIILDRSGSMSGIKLDIIEKFNRFLQKQMDLPGKTTLSLIQFDSENPYEVIYDFEDVQKIPLLTGDVYQPRAMTPLLDAIGKGMYDLEARVNQMKNEEKPEAIVFAVFTDGYENNSKEFSFADVKARMKELEKKLNCEFLFFGTERKGIQEATTVGFSTTMYFKKSRQGIHDAMEHLDYRVRTKKMNHSEK